MYNQVDKLKQSEYESGKKYGVFKTCQELL